MQGVSLSEAGSKETFASIDSTRLAVAVWPLLSNSFVVDHVAISGLKARVIRGKDGQFNFSNLVGGAAPVVTAPANPAEPSRARPRPRRRPSPAATCRRRAAICRSISPAWT